MTDDRPTDAECDAAIEAIRMVGNPTTLARAIIRAGYAAAREAAQPVAWMYVPPPDVLSRVQLRPASERRTDQLRSWSEIPLFAAPLAVADVSRLRDRVERLRGLCKSAVGYLRDADRIDDANTIADLIGDMEAPIAAVPTTSELPVSPKLGVAP